MEAILCCNQGMHILNCLDEHGSFRHRTSLISVCASVARCPNSVRLSKIARCVRWSTLIANSAGYKSPRKLTSGYSHEGVSRLDYLSSIHNCPAGASVPFHLRKMDALWPAGLNAPAIGTFLPCNLKPWDTRTFPTPWWWWWCFVARAVTTACNSCGHMCNIGVQGLSRNSYCIMKKWASTAKVARYRLQYPGAAGGVNPDKHPDWKWPRYRDDLPRCDPRASSSRIRLWMTHTFDVLVLYEACTAHGNQTSCSWTVLWSFCYCWPGEWFSVILH